MAGHHRLHAGGDGLAEGGQFHLLQPLAAVGQQGQFQVGVAGGVAVAREVLGAAEHAGGLQAPQEGRCQGSGAGRILPPGAHVDHRVGRVVVHVAHWPQHPVEPHGPGIQATATAIALGQGAGPLGLPAVQAAEGKGRHQPAGPLEALPHPLLHVGAEQQGLAGPGLQLAGAQGQFGGASTQQDHAAHPQGQQLLQFAIGQFPLGVAALVVGQVAAGADHNKAGDQPLQVLIRRRRGHACSASLS